MGKRSWRRYLLLGLGAALAALAAIVLVVGLGWVTMLTKTRDTPLPSIRRATSPEAVARGGKIFRQVCAACHLGEDGRASGRHLTDFPAFLGKFYARNITSDPEGGVGAWSDEELARMIQTGVARDGHARAKTPNPFMGEDDVAAVIGFLRSDDPLFEPVKRRQPQPQLSFVGNLIITLLSPDPPAPRPGTMAPPVGPTPEYGEYLANSIHHCVGCHTPGYAPADAKIGKPGMYGGGFDFDAPGGGKLPTANITFDPTGIGGWTVDEFSHAVRHGVTRDGYVLRFPMPQYRWVDDVDLRAIYAYLQTVPKVSWARPADPARPRATAEADPEKMFHAFGCVLCHGPGAPFRDKIKNAIGKKVDDVARWIRDAQSVKPGVQMPTFAELIDEPRATALASWVQGYAARP